MPLLTLTRDQAEALGFSLQAHRDWWDLFHDQGDTAVWLMRVRGVNGTRINEADAWTSALTYTVTHGLA